MSDRFFKLIKHLKESDIKFTLLLRSFGPDARKMAAEFEKAGAGIKIHEFKELKNVEVELMVKRQLSYKLMEK